MCQASSVGLRIERTESSARVGLTFSRFIAAHAEMALTSVFTHLFSHSLIKARRG